MSIGPYASKEQLYAAGLGDLLLVLTTLGFQIRCIAVEDIDVGRGNVYVREEVLVHEAVIAFRVLARDTDILILEEDLANLREDAAVLLCQARE
jgi:hypothetical protein